MTVRGGKNRVLIYSGAGLLLVALVLFYHNAATRLDEARTKYEKCHLSEESLSAQLQVILEYKTRLEKSVQQEKSDHAQTKEDMRNKAEEERQTREKENLESINKFTALQQQYKLLQSQHEDVTIELEKAKQQLLTGEEERSQLDSQVTHLTQQNKLLTEEKEGDVIVLQTKLSKLQEDFDKLKSDGGDRLLKERADLQRELADCLRNHSSSKPKTAEGEAESKRALAAPTLAKRAVIKSSTAASRVEIVSGAVSYNTSTPMVNPDAVQSQDATAPGAQGGKLSRIPAVADYKHQEQQQQQANVGGPELDKPPLPLPNSADAERDNRVQLPQAPPLANIIPRNPENNLHYEDDFINKKEEEDDDIGDDYPEKEPEPAKPPPRGIIVNPPHDGVMILPK